MKIHYNDFHTVFEQKKSFILIFTSDYSHFEKNDAKNYILNCKNHSQFFSVNFHDFRIIALHNNGLLKHLKQKYYPDAPISSETKFQGVEFWSTLPILFILCGGILLCLLILLFEIIYYRYAEKRKSKSNWTIHFKHLKLKSLKDTPIFENYP